MRQSLSIIIIGICLLMGFYSFLISQPVLKKIIGAEGRPGQRIEITLKGENLKQVIRVEAVRFDNDKIKVLDYGIESDELIRIEIRIPFGAKPGRHRIAVLVADAKVERWLEPISDNENTTVVQYAVPDIEIFYDDNLIEKEEELDINFAQAQKGLVSKTFTIKNPGKLPISLSNLKLPPELILVGQFPKEIAAEESITFELQLDSIALDSFSGKIQFSLNENDETPYVLQINGNVEQPLPFKTDLDTAAQEPLIVFDTSSVWSQSSKPLIIKNRRQTSITINHLQLPEGFSSSDSTPINIPAGDSMIFQVQLAPNLMAAFDGTLQFDINNIDDNPTDFDITAVAIPNRTAGIEIYDGRNLIIPGQSAPINFGNTSMGSPIHRTFTIRNTGDPTLHLSNLQLPPGFILVGGSFPTTVEAGDSKAFTIEFTADTDQTISGNIRFHTNVASHNSIRIPITGTVQAIISAHVAEPQPFGWLPIAIAAIALSAGLGAGYFLLKGPAKKYWIKKSLSGKTTFQFKPKIDNGFQSIKQSTPIKPDFEMRLKPLLDYGKQAIRFDKELILSASAQTEEAQSRKSNDLTRIEGIGPKIFTILQTSGIATFAQLAETEVSQIQQILTSAGIIGIADPTTWPRQAKLAAEGQWQQLDKWQEELKGGRVAHEKI